MKLSLTSIENITIFVQSIFLCRTPKKKVVLEMDRTPESRIFFLET